jgi:hypothetical protein
MIPTFVKWLLISIFVAMAARAEDVTVLLPGEAVYKQALERARVNFDREVKLASDNFIKILKAEQVRLMQKNDLDGALKIRNRISELSSADTVKESVKAVAPKLRDGEYEFVSRVVRFDITVKEGIISMIEVSNNNHSVSSTWVGDLVFMKWSNTNDLMVLDLLGPNPNIRCWSFMGDLKEIPSGQPIHRWVGKFDVKGP